MKNMDPRMPAVAAVFFAFGCAPVAAPTQPPGLSRIVAHQECRGGDAVACFALAYDYRSRGESLNEVRAEESGREHLGAKRSSGSKKASPAAPGSDALEVAAPKAASPRKEAKQIGADRERKAFEAWVADPQPPLRQLLKPIEMAETFGLDAEFYREHGIHALSLEQMYGAGPETISASLGFIRVEEYAMLLNKLISDQAKVMRRYQEWADRASLTIPDGIRKEQADLSLEWTKRLLYHRSQLGH